MVEVVVLDLHLVQEILQLVLQEDQAVVVEVVVVLELIQEEQVILHR